MADSTLVLVDLDETREGLTPDYESGFVRSLLENAGAKVFNAFSDDGNVMYRSPLLKDARLRQGTSLADCWGLKKLRSPSPCVRVAVAGSKWAPASCTSVSKNTFVPLPKRI